MDAAIHLKSAARGDYTPDPKAERFPTFEEARPVMTLPALFDRWRAEAKPAPSTTTTTKGIVTSLDRHLKGIGVSSITPEQVVAWKDSLVAANHLSPRTINDSYLTMLRALLNWAIANKLLKDNVAKGVKVAVRSQAGQAMLPYSDDEVGHLLKLARAESRPAFRWLPWLAASTGARIGELAQMWGSSIETVDGILVLQIRPAPDAGTLKTATSERTVPLHPALVEEGFLDFVTSRGAGPLFYNRSSGSVGKRHASKGTANHMSDWIRQQEGFDNPRKAPNHAMRHWFKSAMFRVGVQDSVADALQGHASGSAAASYRHFTIPTLAKAIATLSIPRIE